MKKLIVNTIAWILIATDWITLVLSVFFILTEQDDLVGLPATICAVSAFLSIVFIVVDVCIIEEGGTKPL